ncbi:MAG: SH3 domain-containing protein, partial [Chloroflexi bacterium]|nr:SH3 domain-containing protein [Chloroflexota bacterium]
GLMAEPTAAFSRQRAVAGGAGAGLRESPGGPVQEVLPLATAMWVIGRTFDNAWLQVELDDGRAGWVDASEVAAFGLERVPALDVAVLVETQATTVATQPADPTVNLIARVRTDGRRLNLRRGPGTKYGVVGVAENGSTLTVLGRNKSGDWLLVALPGQEDDIAWVAARFLAFDGDVTALPESDRLSAARIIARGGSTSLKGKLVFQTASGGPIMVYDLVAGRSRQLTTGMDPAISPDGETVAFIRDNGGDAGLYLIDMDGSNERRIFTQSKLRAPAWSPDGRWIAFSRVVGQDSCREVGPGLCMPDNPWLGQFPLRVYDVRGLSRVDVNGGSFRDLPSDKQAFAPDWGDRGIIYQSQAGLQITDDAPDATSTAFLNDFRYRDPAWRPDGGAALFVNADKDHREIYRANADGSGVTPLTQPPDIIFHPRPVQHVAPAWSPDGEHIVFLSDLDGDWAFYVMTADGRNQRRLPIQTPITYRFQGEQVVDWGR